MKPGRLLLLAAALLGLGSYLAPAYDSSRPLVSVALLVLFCGGFAALMAGLALTFSRVQSTGAQAKASATD